MERRRENRLSVELPGTYQRAGSEPISMFFSQVSSRGCSLVADDPNAAVGDAVELWLGPIGPIAGAIRWIVENKSGVEFDTALDAAVASYFGAFIDDDG